jgi:Kef-type K+ transport system membrane component KefB
MLLLNLQWTNKKYDNRISHRNRISSYSYILRVIALRCKNFCELFARLKLSIGLGKLVAGIIVGPFALGGLPLFNGEPIVVLNETVKHIGEISAIVILFIAGLEPREFLKGGGAAFTVGSLGVIPDMTFLMENLRPWLRVG